MNTITPIASGGLDVPAYAELLRMAAPKVIANAQENDRAVKLVEQLMEKAERTSEESALLSLLAGLIEDFESEEYALPASTPRERLQFLMDENGVKAGDIAGLMGGRPAVSTALSGKRKVSKEQARKLGEYFGVPPAMFIY